MAASAPRRSTAWRGLGPIPSLPATPSSAPAITPPPSARCDVSPPVRRGIRWQHRRWFEFLGRASAQPSSGEARLILELVGTEAIRRNFVFSAALDRGAELRG